MKSLEELRSKKTRIIKGAGEEKKRKLFYDKGMFTPRERIARLLDPDTFLELDMLATHHYRDFGMDSKEIPAEG
ncbi:MAG: carboxyl transferase domain-containing protein, partial [Deltaproteobacteria bacterium]